MIGVARCPEFCSKCGVVEQDLELEINYEFQ
jgi:hypothetical protein